MATTRIDIHKAIDPGWLIKNKCVLILPKCPVHKVILSSILWEKIPNDKTSKQVAMFLECTEGISERHIYRYMKHNFAFNATTVGVRLMKNEDELEKLKNQSFIVEVREVVSGLTRYHFNVNSKKIEAIEENNKAKIDLIEVNELRNQELTRPAITVERTPQQIDDLGMKISKLVATGIYSVYDACNECGVKWIEFMEWYTTNSYIYELYNQAIKMARFFKNSSYESIADKMLFDLLQYGKVTDTAIEFDRIHSEFKPDGYYVPIKKRVLERGLSMRDLMDLKKQVQGSSEPMPIADEFETLDNDQLAIKIKDLQKEIDKEKSKK